MTKTEIKHKAQEQIMTTLANALLSYQETECNIWSDIPVEEQQKVQEEIKKQADRVAKLMGYREAWHN